MKRYIINPKTKRKVIYGGRTHKKLIKNGVLSKEQKPLDVEYERPIIEVSAPTEESVSIDHKDAAVTDSEDVKGDGYSDTEDNDEYEFKVYNPNKTETPKEEVTYNPLEGMSPEKVKELEAYFTKGRSHLA